MFLSPVTTFLKLVMLFTNCVRENNSAFVVFQSAAGVADPLPPRVVCVSAGFCRLRLP